MRFDPLTKEEHDTSLPGISKDVRPTEKDVEVTDYKYMEFRKPGPKAWGSVLENWHARPQPGILKGATEKQIVVAPWNPLADRGVHDPKPKPFTVPVTRVVNMVSSEYTRHNAKMGSGIQLVPDLSHPTETYYYNPVTRALESSLHRDAYFLGSAPDEDIEECKQICEHYKKNWATISGAERVWAFRLLQYGRAQQAQRAEDRKGWRHLAALGTIVWIASIAPSVPSIVLPATSSDKKINVTVLKAIAPKDTKLYWTQKELSDVINFTQWSIAYRGADGNFSFKCNPRQPLWIKVNDGKASCVDLKDRDTVIERLP